MYSAVIAKLKKKARQTFNKAYHSRPGRKQEAWDKHYEAKREYSKVLRNRDRKSWIDFTKLNLFLSAYKRGPPCGLVIINLN